MREILFRGKDYLCNWHYGSLIQEEYFEPNWEDLENPKTQYNYAIRYKNENDWVSGYKNIEVMPHTIGQYTGLQDKNGKKIFEGDIVEVYAQRNVYGRKQSIEDKYVKVRASVEFSSKSWCGIGLDLNYENNYNKQLCKPKNKEENERQLNTYFLSNYAVNHIRHEKWKFLDDIEIIGNIWDNPELLEVQDVKNS